MARKRVLRWILRIVGGLLVLLAVVIAGALIVLQTAWGRRFVQHEVERALNGLLRGQVAIGKLEGSILGGVVATDLVVTDAAGQEAIRVPRLEASYSLTSLVRNTVALDRVALIDPVVVARRDAQGKLNLTELLPPPSPSTEPSPWRIVVGRATIVRGKVSLDGQQLDGIELDAAVDQAAGRLEVKLAKAQARWVDRDATVAARGAVTMEGDRIEAKDVTVETGKSRLAIARAAARTDGSEVDAEVSLQVEPADVRRFGPVPPELRGALSASGTVVRKGANEPYRVAWKGKLAGASWSLEARAVPDPPAAAGSFQIDGVDPAAVWATAPAGRVELSARADVAGKSLATLRGTVHAETSGELDGNRVDRLVADVDMVEGELRARVDGQAPGAKLHVDAAVDPASQPMIIRSARIQAQVPQLARFTGKLPVGGDVAADLTVSGTPQSLRAKGTVRGTALRYETTRMASLAVDVDVSGLPAEPAGRASIDASGVQQGTTMIGRVQADGDFRDRGRSIDLSLRAGGPKLPYGGAARAHIDRAGDGTISVQIRELQVKTRQLAWNGSVGTVTLSPRGDVEVKNVSLASSAGQLRASGQLRTAGDQLAIAVKGAQIHELREAIAPDAPDVRGTVDVELTVARRNRRLHQVQAKVAAKGLEWRPETDPISLDIDASLNGRNVEGSLSVDGGRTGTFKLEIATRTPVDPLDLKAWQRFDERDLKRVHLEMERLDLERLADLVNVEPKPVGTVHANVDVGAGLATLKAKIDAEGIRTAYLDSPLSTQTEIELRDHKLHIDAKAERQGGGGVELAARIAAPARLSDVEQWKRLDIDDVELAKITFDRFTLAWLQPIRERFPDIQGTVEGTVTARAKGEDIATADVQLDGLRAAGLLMPMSVRLQASLYPDRVSAEISSQLGEHRLAIVEASIAAGLDAIRGGRTMAFQTAAARASAKVEKFPLEVVKQAINLPGEASGGLSLQANLSGTLAEPTIDAEAALADGKIGSLAFDKLGARGRLDPKTFSASVTAAQHTGGSFDASVTAKRENVLKGKATFKAQKFDLSFLSLFATERGLKFTKGMIEADLAVEGTPAEYHALGWLALTGGDMRLTEAVETFHDANLRIDIRQNDALTVKLDSKVGNKGRMALDASANLVGTSVRDAKGTFTSKKLSVSAGRTAVIVDTRTTFTGRPEGGLYQLEVSVESGRLSLPKLGGGAALHPTDTPEDVMFVDSSRGPKLDTEVVKPSTEPFLRIRVRTPNDILVISEEGRAKLDANLNLTMSAAETSIRGVVRVEDGFAELFGRRWALQASRVVFEGESPPNPRLDVKLDYEFRTTTVNIAVAGRLNKPELQLSSSSGAYDQAQLLGFVLGGSPDEAAGEAGNADISQQAMGAATGLLFGQVQSVLKKAIPVDVLSIQQKTGAKEETLFTVGKWVSPAVFVSYQHRAGSETEERDNTDEGTLQWYFLRGLRFDAVFGNRGEGSADVLWIRRW